MFMTVDSNDRSLVLGDHALGVGALECTEIPFHCFRNFRPRDLGRRERVFRVRSCREEASVSEGQLEFAQEKENGRS
jgi:hypothetical protein